MLRRDSPSPEKTDPPGFVPWPSPEEAFVLGFQPWGVHFYTPEGALFQTYAGLQRMRLQEGRLILTFERQEILVEGEGLHSLYAQLGLQKVRRVHQQPERSSDLSPFHIRRIVIQPVPGTGLNFESATNA